MSEEKKFNESILGEHLILSHICVIELGLSLKKLAEQAFDDNQIKLFNKLSYIANSYKELATCFMKIINPDFDDVSLSANFDEVHDNKKSNDLVKEAKFISELTDLFKYHFDVASKIGVLEISNLYEIAISINKYNLMIIEEFL